MQRIRKPLDAVGHSAYAISTPEGVFDKRDDDFKFTKWINTHGSMK